MNKTKIPWADYTTNPVKGLCPMVCPYCYARRMYKRFKWDETIRFDEDALLQPMLIEKPSKIFVGSTMELFGDWARDYMDAIFYMVKRCPQHTFIFLTKQPQNLIKWSPFPENCWVGASATDIHSYYRAKDGLDKITAKVKFISFEPLLDSVGIPGVEFLTGINWLIIGSQTQPVRHPRKEWVDEIITATDKAKIPIFVKEPLASYYDIQRQEFPNDHLPGLRK